MRKQATTSIGCWCDAAGCLGFRHARSRSDAGDAAIATSYRPRSVAPRSHEGDRLDAAHHRRAASIARICTSNIPRLSKLGASNPGTRRPIDAQPQQEGAPVRKQ